MKVEDVKNILENESSVKISFGLSLVNLTEKERFVIVLRYMAGLTQPETVERLPYVYSEMLKIPIEQSIQKYTFALNSIQNWEKKALEKCAKTWSKKEYAELFSVTQ